MAKAKAAKTMRRKTAAKKRTAGKISKGHGGGGRRKLTEAAVATIRSTYEKGKTTYAELAKKYGISASGIQAVISGKTWAKA